MPFQPVVPAFLRRLWPRAVAPATVVLALLSACGLSSMEAAPFVSSAQAHMPSPVQSPAWPEAWPGQMARAEPGPVRFSPPSAEHCRRLPGLREVSWPGAPQQEALLGRRRIHGESEARLESAAPATPAAAPAPGSTGASRTVVNELKKSITDGFRGDGALDSAAAAAAPRVAESAAATPFVMPPAHQPPPPQPERRRPAHEVVTAGMVDDNADFGEYRAYRERALRAGVNVRDRDVGERTLLEVTDARGRPVHDAEVAVQRAGQAQPVMWARTDTAGRVWLHPRVFLPAEAQQQDARWGVAVRKGRAQARAVWQRGQSQALQVRLVDAPQPQGRARLDLVFLVDATGSMGDEIAKLKSSMRAMADQLSQLPGSPDVCYGLVTYRDRGDAYLTRSHDFTNDLSAFQAALGRVQAQGGGDTPEALNEALSETVHGLSWRQDAVRLVVLVADAPPHLDYCDGSATSPQQQQQAAAPCPQYDQDMQAALAKGIKLLAVGAGGLDPSGEFIFRQMAQYTAGRFVFLTYKNAAQPSSGPGGETLHDVTQYSVQTLDKLVVRLVGEELARLRAGAV